MITMPRYVQNPRKLAEYRGAVSVSGFDDSQLIELTLNQSYETTGARETMIQARVRVSLGQFAAVGGLVRWRVVMEDLVETKLGIHTDEFSNSVIGFQTVEGRPSKFGTWKIEVDNGGHHSNFYPPDDKWGTMEHVWRRGQFT